MAKLKGMGFFDMGIGGSVRKNRSGLPMVGPRPVLDEAAYTRIFPYYAELCALSELRKKPGFGAAIRSGIGGHSLLYLNGVQRDREAGYPVLQLCAPAAAPGRHGVGISVNSHYKNANWVAAEGRDFVWHGALEPGEPLTREAYARTQAAAQAAGVLDGVEFHGNFFKDKPPGMAERDFMYEISVATDYAACFGRDTFRTRVPLDAARMAAVVAYLNALNQPYREGRKIFEWRVLNNNCSHIAHNALAAAGLWAPKPTGQFIGFAAFRFPVPKNELVDLALRTNDLPVANAQAMFGDVPARNMLMQFGALPTAPGALASSGPAIVDNEVYDVDGLRLIFFDDPFVGPYRFRFARIFTQARFLDLRANFLHFAEIYAAAAKNRSAGHGFSGARARFQTCYEEYIADQTKKITQHLAALEKTREAALETVN